MEEIIKQWPAPSQGLPFWWLAIQLTQCSQLKQKGGALSTALSMSDSLKLKLAYQHLTEPVGNAIFLDCQELGTQNRI